MSQHLEYPTTLPLFGLGLPHDVALAARQRRPGRRLPPPQRAAAAALLVLVPMLVSTAAGIALAVAPLA